MRSLLVAAAAALLAGASPAQQQYNIRFNPDIVIMPVHWNGQPAFMLGIPRGANQFMTFYEPGFIGMHEVVLHVDLVGIIDGRECVDNPWQPMHINFGRDETLAPWFRVHRGVNLYVPDRSVLRYYYAGIEDNYATVRSLWFDARYRSVCGEPELIFFIVTPELIS